MIPYSVERYDAGAVFMARMKPRLGVKMAPLTDEVRRQRGSNQGLLVEIVVEGSPAYLADILPGDLLLAIGDTPIYSSDDFKAVLDKASTGPVKFDLVRNKQRISKLVTLRSF